MSMKKIGYYKFFFIFFVCARCASLLYLSLLQYSEHWLVPNKQQEHVKHETDRMLTQNKLKRNEDKKYDLILQNITKVLQNTYYKLIEKKVKNAIPNWN